MINNFAQPTALNRIVALALVSAFLAFLLDPKAEIQSVMLLCFATTYLNVQNNQIAHTFPALSVQ